MWGLGVSAREASASSGIFWSKAQAQPCSKPSSVMTLTKPTLGRADDQALTVLLRCAGEVGARWQHKREPQVGAAAAAASA